MRLAELEEANRRMLAQAPLARPVTTSDIIKTHRKRFPYKGWVEIESPYCDPFVVFCANDDAVALDTLWNGAFSYEPGSLSTWSRLAAKSQNIADVGAHVGYFSLIAAMANPDAKIHSFEPVDFIHARLAVNQRANNLQNIKRFQAGVSHQLGHADINVRFSANLLSTGSSLETTGSAAVTPEAKRIKLLTLDSVFADTKLDLIKIDVEGHELHVLEGAREVLGRDRPTVVLEALRDTEMRTLLDHFEPHGYDSHWLSEREGTFVPLAEGRPPGTRNLIFTPHERGRESW